MADRIKNSQQRHTQDRFVNSGARRDVLFPDQHQTISDPLGAEWKFVGPNNTPVLSEQVVFDIPKTGYIGEMAIEFNLAAPSAGNYTDYVGICMIDRLTLLSQSGNELHDYDYVSVLQSIMATLPDECRRTIREAAGSTGFGGPGRVICPVPYFGSKLAHRGQPQAPLPSHMLQGKMRLEVNLKTLANILDAGASGGGLTSMRLWYLHYNASDEQRQRHFNNRSGYKYKSVDWQTNINNAHTGAATNYDISGFHGSLNSLYIMNKSQANKDTANDYYVLSTITDMRVLADGDQLYDVDSANSQLLLGYLHNRQYDDNTFGDGVSVNFGYADPSNKNSEYVGSLHLNDVNQLEIDSLVGVASSYIDIVGSFDVEYTINSSGDIRRYR